MRIIFYLFLVFLAHESHATQCGPLVNFKAEFEKSSSVVLVKAISARVPYQDFVSNFKSKRRVYADDSEEEFNKRLAKEWSKYDENQKYADFIVVKDFKNTIPSGKIIRALDSLGVDAKYIAGSEYILFFYGYDSVTDVFGSDACFYIDVTNKKVISRDAIYVDIYGVAMNQIMNAHRNAPQPQNGKND